MGCTPTASRWGFTPWSCSGATRNVPRGAAREKHREEASLMWNRVKLVLAGALIVLGIAAFIYQASTHVTEREVGIDPAPPSTERGRGFPLPLIIGAVSLVGGVTLLLMDPGDFKRAATPKRAHTQGGSR